MMFDGFDPMAELRWEQDNEDWEHYGYESYDDYENALQENQDNLDIKSYYEDREDF